MYREGDVLPLSLSFDADVNRFDFPGDPNTSVAVDYHYPEKFGVTNKTEAASAKAKLASQSAAYPTPATPTPTHQRTAPTPGLRQLNFPPYVIQNNAVPGNSLVKQVIAPNATHNDAYSSTEYELHNLYGMSLNVSLSRLFTDLLLLHLKVISVSGLHSTP